MTSVALSPIDQAARAAPTTTSGAAIIDCYVRNSTAFQVDNWRAEHQREVLPQLATQHGYSFEIWDEQGTSGESLEKRKKLRTILDRITAGQSAGIACVAFDRLSRDIDVVDGLVIWRTCKDAGAIIITPDRVWRPGVDADDDIAFIQFWMAGRNKRQQLDNLYQGMVQRAAAVPMLRGSPLHGYLRQYEQYVDERGRQRTRAVVQIDPEVTELTVSIFSQFPHRSARSLANELNAKGPAFWLKRWHKDGTTARVKWQVKQIIRMVHNPLYKGVVIWGRDSRSRRVQGLLAGRSGRPFVHDVPELRIVDPATWAACQVVKEGSPTRHRRGEGLSPRTVGSDAVFGGLLRCPGCGATMYYRNTYVYLKGGRKLDPSYLCGRYHRQASCGSYHVREAELLDLLRSIVGNVLQRLDTEALVREELEREQAEDQRPAKEAELRTIEEAKAKVREDRYIKRIIGDADFAQFMQAFSQRQQVLEAELAALNAAQSGAAETEFASLREWLSGQVLQDLIASQNRDFWRVLSHRLFAHISPGYEYRGMRRKARVWLAETDCELRAEVRAMLDTDDQAQLCPTVTPMLMLGWQSTGTP